jgi:hypothetical protein
MRAPFPVIHGTELDEAGNPKPLSPADLLVAALKKRNRTWGRVTPVRDDWWLWAPGNPASQSGKQVVTGVTTDAHGRQSFSYATVTRIGGAE